MIPSQKEFEPKELVPAATHIARVISIIYMGTVTDIYPDGTTKTGPKVNITWEIPNELRTFKEGEEKKPMVISREFGFSLYTTSALRPIVQGIIGTSLTDEEAKGFDVDNIMGMACLINVIHKKKKDGTNRADVASVSPMMKGLECPPQVNPNKIISYDKWNQEAFDALPKWIREKMEKTPEYRKLKGLSEEAVIDPESVPF